MSEIKVGKALTPDTGMDYYSVEEWEDTFGYNPLDLEDMSLTPQEAMGHGHARKAEVMVAVAHGVLYSITDDYAVIQGYRQVNVLHRFILPDEHLLQELPNPDPVAHKGHQIKGIIYQTTGIYFTVEDEELVPNWANEELIETEIHEARCLDCELDLDV